jgi:HPt (histidine-containing phosphotransfer) domain-containing protein
MTAHAMEGDRERCLEAGMDGYIAKPLDAEELFSVVESLVPMSDEAEGETGAVVPGTPLAFDMDTALKRMGGSEALLKEIVDMFFEESRDLLLEVERAIAARDDNALQRAAHTLKGLVRNFGAESAAREAQRIEMMAADSELQGVEGVHAKLREEVERLTRELREWRTVGSRK